VGADQIRSTLGTNALYGGQSTTFYGVKDTDTVVNPGSNPTYQQDQANPLQPVASAQQLRDWVIQNSVTDWSDWFGQPASRVTPETVTGTGGVMTTGGAAGGGGGGGAAGGGVAPSTDSGSTPVSGTNTQVAGVDEADILKTDGQYLYSLTGGHFFVIDGRNPSQLALVGNLDLGADIGNSVIAFYLMGDRAVVLSQSFQFAPPADWPTMLVGAVDPAVGIGGCLCWPAFYKTQTVVTTIDVSDRTAPTILHETKLDGSLVDSRVVDGRLYTVVDNSLYFPQPLLVDTPAGTAYESEADYRSRLTSDLTGALPGYTTTEFGAGGTVEGSGSLVDGASLYLPETMNGQELLTIAAFDPAADTANPVGVTTIAGSTGVVYASTSSLYIASTDYYSPWDGTLNTQIYKFALNGDSVPLDGVGTVQGTVLNQFSMDEHNGYFRIATTNGWGSGANNAVYVMADTGENLDVVGSITNLSPGEQIRSVRFDGDTGYVTTFLQTDPLFTLDLSDPTHPDVAGELIIPGFSSYLQTLGNGLVVGVGRDADPMTGAVLGLQLSLFDVSDPANPKQLDVFSFSGESWGGSSDAEWDHHAISWFPDVGVLTLPVSVSWDQPATLEVMHLGTDGIKQLGEIGHDSPVMRSLRIGDQLFSMSASEIKANNLTDPSVQTGEVNLPVPITQPIPVDFGPPVVIFATAGGPAAA